MLFENVIADYSREISHITNLAVQEVQEKFMESTIKYKSRNWTIAESEQLSTNHYMSVELVSAIDTISQFCRAISQRLGSPLINRLGLLLLDFVDKHLLDSVILASAHPFTQSGARQLEFDVFTAISRAFASLVSGPENHFKRFDVCV